MYKRVGPDSETTVRVPAVTFRKRPFYVSGSYCKPWKYNMEVKKNIC